MKEQDVRKIIWQERWKFLRTILGIVMIFVGVIFTFYIAITYTSNWDIAIVTVLFMFYSYFLALFIIKGKLEMGK